MLLCGPGKVPVLPAVAVRTETRIYVDAAARKTVSERAVRHVADIQLAADIRRAACFRAECTRKPFRYGVEIPGTGSRMQSQAVRPRKYLSENR